MYASDGEAAEAGSMSNSASRRPMNAFLLFCNRHRAIVKEKYPNLENRSVTKILGEWWQSLDDDEKSNFNHLASEYKEFMQREQPGLRWRKQSPSRGEPGARRPSPSQLHHDPDASRFSTSSHGSSSSSSPEPGPCSSSAPKPFKKRYLAAEKAKLTGEELDGSAAHSGSVSPDAEHACEALLQLAGVRGASPPQGAGCPERTKPPGEGFRTLRDAVWSRVAHTLLKQEEEKGSGGHASDVPLNLSSQCTIRGQTIIEHIIENILDKPLVEGNESQAMALNLNNNRDILCDASAPSSEAVAETAEQIKQRIYQSLKRDGIKTDTSSLWKMLPHDSVKKGSANESDQKADAESSEEDSISRTKEGDESDNPSALAQSAVKNEEADAVPAVSVTLVPATVKKASVSPTPVRSQSHSVTITPTSLVLPLKRAAEDDDDDIRRSSRSCKGRRYQEFKDEGRLGRNSNGGTKAGVATGARRMHHRSGGSASNPHDDGDSVSILPLNGEDNTHSGGAGQFDVHARLSAIPALSLEAYQQKVLRAKAAGGSGVSTRSARGPPPASSGGSPTGTTGVLRRRSCELQQREDGHVKARKGRRGMNAAGSAAEINVSS